MEICMKKIRFSRKRNEKIKQIIKKRERMKEKRGMKNQKKNKMNGRRLIKKMQKPIMK